MVRLLTIGMLVGLLICGPMTATADLFDDAVQALGASNLQAASLDKMGRALKGGLVAGYVPTVPQVDRFHSTLESSERFVDVETFEILLRTWHVAGRSVRPDHGMVGHTGFVTTARCVSPP